VNVVGTRGRAQPEGRARNLGASSASRAQPQASTADRRPSTTRGSNKTNECIDCGGCVPECPVEAIYDETQLPENKTDWTAINRRDRNA
jgi:ferredoxin